MYFGEIKFKNKIQVALFIFLTIPILFLTIFVLSYIIEKNTFLVILLMGLYCFLTIVILSFLATRLENIATRFFNKFLKNIYSKNFGNKLIISGIITCLLIIWSVIFINLLKS